MDWGRAKPPVVFNPSSADPQSPCYYSGWGGLETDIMSPSHV